MSDLPPTRASLLVRIRDPHNGEAWTEFVDLYAPVVYRFACKQGLQDADAADLTQDVLSRVASAVPSFEYEPRKGSFRGWLFTIVRNRLRDLFDKERHQVKGSGDTELQVRLEQHPGDAELNAIWEREFEQQLLQTAAQRVKKQFQEKTWQAFWRTTVEGEEIKDVAQSLGLSVAAVYLARSRVMARLKEQVRECQEIS